MPLISRVASVRAVVLVLLGVAVGAGAAPAVASLRPDASTAVVQSRSFSCPGLGFHPAESLTTYAYNGAELWRTDNNSNAKGFFVCNAVLPTRAVVTKVQFTVFDGDVSSAVDHCGLIANNLNGDPNPETLAMIRTTGVGARPGYKRLTDSTIDYATINNNRYAYTLQRRLDDHTPQIGLFGADVIYNITPGNG